MPCRIPRRAREAPGDDRQAQPAPTREKRFHAYEEPRHILRNPDEPIASMSGGFPPELEPTSRKPKPVIGVLSPDLRFRDAVQLVGMAGMGALLSKVPLGRSGQCAAPSC